MDSTPSCISEFKDVFRPEIGKLKGMQVKLNIGEKVKPVKQTHRRIPFHISQQVEDELKRLQDQDIIEEVKGPTPWVSPVVAAPKPKSPTEIRLCIDIREANRAIQRHISPPWMISYMTSMALQYSHIWTYDWGTTSHVRNISDDIIIFGKGKTQAEAETAHDASLHEVLKRFRERGITLNAKKCEYKKTTLPFFGHIFDETGMSPAPEKVEAVQECDPPTDPSAVRSLLGMRNFCARYAQNYSYLVKPLWDLTRNDVPWEWRPEKQTTLNNVKTTLTGDTVLSYFDT